MLDSIRSVFSLLLSYGLLLLPNGLFLMSAGVSGFLGVFALYRMRKRAAKGIGERPPVIEVPAGQIVSAQMYANLRDAMDRDLARMSGGLRRL